MKITYYITGKRPAISKQSNDLLKYFDLGIEGAFIYFSHKIVCELEEGISEEKLLRQPEGIKLAYEDIGYINVSIAKEEIIL